MKLFTSPLQPLTWSCPSGQDNCTESTVFGLSMNIPTACCSVPVVPAGQPPPPVPMQQHCQQHFQTQPLIRQLTFLPCVARQAAHAVINPWHGAVLSAAGIQPSHYLLSQAVCPDRPHLQAGLQGLEDLQVKSTAAAAQGHHMYYTQLLPS